MSGRLWVLIVSIMLLGSVPSLYAHPSLFTGNQFVWAEVDDSTGWITFAEGPVTDRTLGAASHTLSHKEGSFLWVMVNGTEYTNQTEWNSAADALLTEGRISKIGVTLRVIWRRTGFDIVQDVYPVAFLKSGLIVLRVTVINHTGKLLTARAQYLLDDEIDGIVSPQNGARSLTHYPRGFYSAFSSIDACYPGPSDTIAPPPFFMAFSQVAKQTSFLGNVVGVGYLSDELAPTPLGLVRPSMFAIGAASNVAGKCAWGKGFYGGESYSDEAMFMVWPSVTVAASGKDTNGIVACTSYGTGAYEVCAGNVTAITFYPNQIQWMNGTLIPTRFTIESLIVGDTLPSLQASLSVSGQQRIIAPLPVNSGGTIQLQTFGAPGNSGLIDAIWTDSVFSTSDGAISLTLTLSGVPTPPFLSTCSLPLTVVGIPNQASSLISTISRSGSFDGSLCNTRCTQAQASDPRLCMTCFVRSVSAIALQNMTFTVTDSTSWKFSVCVIDSMKNGSATVIALEGTGEIDTANYTYCTIADKQPPLVRPGFKVDTATGWAVEVDEQRPWDRGLDTIIVKSLTGLQIDATRPADMNVHGLSHAWISVIPNGVVPTRLICIQAKDLAGNTIDTCLTFGPADVPGIASAAAFSCEAYPNPTSGVVTIKLLGAGGAEVEVLDILGRTVDAFRMRQSLEWDASSFGNGTYIVRVTAGGLTISKRIAKQ